MNTEEAYKHWSKIYDSNENKTRDLEAKSLRETLNNGVFENCLEIGCGTGKNTEWLKNKCEKILAIDLSQHMLEIAENKIKSENVKFLKVDINHDWNFTNDVYDLVVCSLVLEHIENIDRVFELIGKHLKVGGILYVGELHPFKQYSGSKARFQNNDIEQVVECFTHHVSEFTRIAKKYNFKIEDINEYFDDENEKLIPRILTFKFIK
ncbi:class I SAM-dependent methyltransferase [Kaistella flava (ex Peng et al. 2021)]|uniref:Class I SAM-dependent methyltransferase n=1 Tax=Kaistella flava (ex Peng et al. 2021) TaxID=2038776 RepID=A0A7M2Y3T6_9FLAO|nr:class I SAM-dependent methyltransferase [Kaistella flava (ex Peng et al. 2021)]QOW08888.1 class I SAM-dependent methyltransferase [Kaistella flava (ex Peng et al. 2021)]